MGVELQHPMKPELTPEEAARSRFVSGIRSFILNDLAGDLRAFADHQHVGLDVAVKTTVDLDFA